jgi:flagellar biosynthesis protein FlhG
MQTELSKINKKRFTSPPRCKFVAVASGKGGVGKTCFTINYAITLAKKGKKVIILDADLGMANIDVLLKISTRYNLLDVIDGKKSLPDIITDVPGGFKIIPGGSGLQELSSLTQEQISRVTSGFSYLQDNFDYVLIDTGAGLSKSVTDFIFCSDETVILTTPEPHAITDAYSLIKVILNSNKNVTLKLIVNKCESIISGKAILKKIYDTTAGFLEYKLIPAEVILESKVVSRSIMEQKPFCLSYPLSEPAKNIERIVDEELGNFPVYDANVENTGFIKRFKVLLGR